MLCKEERSHGASDPDYRETRCRSLDLCEECAKAKGVDDPTGFSLARPAAGPGASQEIEQPTGGAESKCPRCGFSQADFKKAGRLGCARMLQRRLPKGWKDCSRSMHKGTRHVGKVPESLRQPRSAGSAEDIRQLQTQLESSHRGGELRTGRSVARRNQSRLTALQNQPSVDAMTTDFHEFLEFAGRIARKRSGPA